MLRCVIVDDSPIFLEAARSLLERQGASVVGVAVTSEDDALRVVAELRPDLTLLDVHVAGESGFVLARRLCEEVGVEPGRMILISTESAEEYAELIVDAPVAGFLSKAALSVAEIRELIASE